MEHDAPPSPSTPPPLGAPPPPPLLGAPAAPPPPITPPPPSRPAGGRGRGWMVVALILLVLLLLSVGGNLARHLSGIGSGTRHVRHGGRAYEETVIENNGSANKIAVVSVNGIITSEALDRTGRSLVAAVKDQLDMAGNDRAVRAVILKIDSPGGEVIAADDINRAIKEFQQQTGKPVIADMGGLAASGGYYIAVPCRWIVANALTITGSIGVIMHTYNYRGLLDKVGVRPVVFKSGKFKDMLSGEQSPDQVLPEERAMVQSLVNETFQRFKQVVAEGRQRAHQRNQPDGRVLVKNWADYADGRILSGQKAFEYGFVDELGDFDAAVRQAERLARLGRGGANLIRYTPVIDLSDLLGWLVRAHPATLKVDLGMDLPRLEAGRLYFLPSTLLE